jgi:hypothetical protein
MDALNPIFRQAAVLMAKVLHGASPASLPVEQSTRSTSRLPRPLGIEVPPILLSRADELIE